ncbi:hypothetical protein R1flu_024341 [Riccia fluitans]|uniref:Prephenate dehydratase domain-containing protein n=1 Tax=Riccia fluitans TaxID=41844 RepID=A0ABD1XUL7_9MARC
MLLKLNLKNVRRTLNQKCLGAATLTRLVFPEGRSVSNSKVGIHLPPIWQICQAAEYNVSELPQSSSPYVDHHRSAQWQTLCAVFSGQWATAQLEEQKSLIDSFDEGSPINSGDETNNRGLIALPKPLSLVDLALQPKHNAQLRVSYQGVLGAYSEAAVAKAYPNKTQLRGSSM